MASSNTGKQDKRGVRIQYGKRSNQESRGTQRNKFGQQRFPDQNASELTPARQEARLCPS